jgi:UDP:flavonoid glycosyltransferase YjiC (YdhE family)
VYLKDALARESTLCVAGHSLDDFGRLKSYIIDRNSSWKENQRQKRESLWIRELQTLHIAKDHILLSCRLAMGHLCVLQLETALATLVTTWFTLTDRR